MSKLNDFKKMLDEIQKATKAAGLTPKDIEETIKEVGDGGRLDI